MTENAIHIKLVQEKLTQLLKNYQSLQKENLSMAGIITSLKNKEAEMKVEMDLLHARVQILQASAGRMPEADQKDF